MLDTQPAPENPLVPSPAATPAVVPPPVPSAEAETPPEVQDITVIARYPYQMEKCQTELIAWCAQKIAATKAEAADLHENYEIAKKNKWGSAALHRAWQRAEKTVEYYEKMKLALEAGYCIVPNFPVDMIAIRTTKKKPRSKDATGSSFQAAQIDPETNTAGEGRYVNPSADINKAEVDGKNWKGEAVKDTVFFPVAFNSQVDFPFTTAKPEILSATARAMADKMFDEIGVLPGRRPKGDPIIVGRIRDPRAGKYNPKFITFLIAWYIDTRAL